MRLLFTYAVLFLVGCGSHWEEAGELQYARMGASGGVLNNRVILSGGFHPIEILEERDDQLVALDIKPSPLFEEAGSVVYQEKLWLFGGINPGHEYLDDVRVVDLNGNISDVVKMPFKAKDLAIVVRQDKIILAGGDDFFTFRKEVWSFDPLAKTFVRLQDLPDGRKDGVLTPDLTYLGGVGVTIHERSGFGFIDGHEIGGVFNGEILSEAYPSNLPIPLAEPVVLELDSIYVLSGQSIDGPSKKVFVLIE